MNQEETMPYRPTPANPTVIHWLYLGTATVPVISCTRRRVVVEVAGVRYQLHRRKLERDGYDTANGHVFRLSRYDAPRTAA